MYSGTLKQPPSNRKKIVLIAIIAVVVCLSASGGLYYMFKGSSDRTDEFGRRRREWRDANLPNPDKQKPQEIMAYMDSAEFKKLAPRKQFEYMRQGGRQVMEYQMETYFSLPDEKQKTAYLDQMIDRMQAQRVNFEQMARDANGPRRFRDANEPNDPNRPSRQQGQAGGRRTQTASGMRARSERGTALQRAQRDAFMTAMRKRMQQRGISMPGPGGRGGPGGGLPGGR
jgi:hypothetical protein